MIDMIRKKNQILHDLKRLSSELDRLHEDIEELCEIAKGGKDDKDNESSN